MLTWLLALLTAPVHAAVLREDVGQLKIHDLLLRPNFTLSEPKSGLFSLGESNFALRWELDEEFSGVIRIGPRALLNPVARFTPTVNDDVTLVEAFAEYNSPYGRFRLGVLPIEFGYEGRQWERNLIFPRSLLFTNRVVALRDVGASFEISENNFFTGFVIHNGESRSQGGGQLWYTARWGYRTQDFEIGLAGQTGSTKPSQTADSLDTLAGVDVTEGEKWRHGGVYGALTGRDNQAVIEFYVGELQQQKVTGYRAGHADYGHEWSKTFSTCLRYDVFDPNTSRSGDLQQSANVALVWSNKTHSSNLIGVFTRHFDEDHRQPNDEFRVIWSLSPSGIVRF